MFFGLSPKQGGVGWGVVWGVVGSPNFVVKFPSHYFFLTKITRNAMNNITNEGGGHI